MNKSNDDLVKHIDGVKRCWWCGTDEQYVEYHDNEWGYPVTNDQRLFEKICLEGFQAGLSWITILRKREAFRESFEDFEIERVARFTKRDVNRIVKNAAIVRHRGKIESTINNAKRAIEMGESFSSISDYFWQYQPSARPALKSRSEIAANTDESTAMSKDLKKRGWSFVGPTTCYAFMQAMGLVNDHLAGCKFHRMVERTQA